MTDYVFWTRAVEELQVTGADPEKIDEAWPEILMVHNDALDHYRDVAAKWHTPAEEPLPPTETDIARGFGGDQSHFQGRGSFPAVSSDGSRWPLGGLFTVWPLILDLLPKRPTFKGKNKQDGDTESAPTNPSGELAWLMVQQLHPRYKVENLISAHSRWKRKELGDFDPYPPYDYSDYL